MDYAFFNDALRQRFQDFLRIRSIPYDEAEDAVAGTVVRIPDELDDDTTDAVEDLYETLMDEQLTLAGADEDLLERQLAGVTVTLEDGTTRTLRLPGPIARKLLEHFSAAEVHDIVTAIARSVASPVDAPLCRDG